MKRSPLQRRTPLSRSTPLRAKAPMKRKARKAHTVAEDAHLDRVAALGCFACWRESQEEVPALVHHSRTRPDGQKYGASVRAPHSRTFPLCDDHHRNTGALGVAFHAGEPTWEAKFGDENSILAWVDACLHGPFIVPPPLGAPFPQVETHAPMNLSERSA